jgi:hypothetical protein
MLHYPDDDTTDLIAPQVVQTKPDKPRMTVTAERGAVSADGEEVFLYDNVLLVRDGSAERSETRMRTDFLHIARGGTVAITDREVVITKRRACYPAAAWSTTPNRRSCSCANGCADATKPRKRRIRNSEANSQDAAPPRRPGDGDPVVARVFRIRRKSRQGQADQHRIEQDELG